MEAVNRAGTILIALMLVSCSPMLETRQIASIYADGVTSSGRLSDAYTQIESTLDGLTEILRKEEFYWHGKEWAEAHGKKYDYGWFLTGEREYTLGYTYRPSEHSFAQCTVGINRKTAKLTFFESEWPFESGQFPMSEIHREHIRHSARIAADYLRRKLPSHNVQISFEQKRG